MDLANQWGMKSDENKASTWTTSREIHFIFADGLMIHDLATKTLPNGFVDLWLPRNEKIDVTVEARGLTATERIGTSDTDPTCVTTLKLHY